MIKVNSMSIIKIIMGITIIILLTSCTPEVEKPPKTRESLLSSLGINGPNDYSQLSVCKKVEIFSLVGSKFLDIDHAIALVPTWMNDELSRQPRKEITDCIAARGELLLSQWSDVYNSENENRALQVHALIYKAVDLDLVGEPQIESFILSAVCDAKVYYSSRIAILYYAQTVQTQSDLYNFPDPDEIITKMCN